MPLHIALIGAGGISQTHARAASTVPGVAIAAVHGTNPERTRQLAASYDAAAYDDLDACLAHYPLDAVVIGSPSGVHAEQGIRAAERGLHVLVEKPLDVTLQKADALIDATERAGVRLGVMFQDRTRPSFERLRRALADGRAGRPLLASARVKWYRPPEYYSGSKWRGTWALDGGGAVMNQGIHTVDLLGWLLGPVRWVTARTAALLHPIEVEDTALALFEFASGATATFEATTIAYPGFARRIELTTTEGTIVIENDRVIAADLKNGAGDLVDPPADAPAHGTASPVVADVSGHARLIEDFAAAIQERRDALCSGREGRKSLANVLALYDSAARRVPVSPDEPF